jgi:hypothetical protein
MGVDTRFEGWGVIVDREEKNKTRTIVSIRANIRTK